MKPQLENILLLIFVIFILLILRIGFIQLIQGKDLQKLADISNYTVSKLTRGDNVTVDVLEKICIALDCGIEEIIEFTKTEDCQKIR